MRFHRAHPLGRSPFGRGNSTISAEGEKDRGPTKRARAGSGGRASEANVLGGEMCGQTADALIYVTYVDDIPRRGAFFAPHSGDGGGGETVRFSEQASWWRNRRETATR